MIKGMVRPPAVAGSFYPSEAVELRAMIEGFLSEAKETAAEGKLKGLIVPHAGYVYSGPVAAYGFKLLAKEEWVRKVMVVGVSHSASFFGAAESGADYWKTPLGKVKCTSIRKNLENPDLIPVIPEAHAHEHSVEVQVPFLQSVLRDFTITPLLTGEVLPEALAGALEPLIDGETFFLASSDLSHYHSYERAVELDSAVNKAVPALNIKAMEGCEACGKIAIMTLMHIAKKRKWKAKLLDYRNSGDTAGPKDQVVGYGCYAFYE